MKIVVKKKEIKGGLFAAGTHLGVIAEVSEDTPSKKDTNPWSDVTPQLRVKVKNDNGFINHWFSMKGFKNITDFEDGIAPEGHVFLSSAGFDAEDEEGENYLCKVTTIDDEEVYNRVECEERTNDALGIFGEFVAEAAPEMVGEDFDSDNLAFLDNRSIGVEVKLNDYSKPRVHYFLEAERAESKIAELT